MRRLAAVAMLATALASCAPPSAVAPPTEAPPSPSASPIAETPAPTAEPSFVPRRPSVVVPQTVAVPDVKVDRRVFAVGPTQGFVAASAEVAAGMEANLAGLEKTYGELLTNYANLPRLDPAQQSNVRMQFDTWMGSGPLADMVRGWLAIRYADEVKTVTIRDFTFERFLAKPWGRPALVEAHFAIVDRSQTASGAPSERRHDVRVRISVATSWTIIDVYDATAGRWVAGDTPRYSPLVLEDEVTRTVGAYLQGESYLQGALVPGGSGRWDTEFWRVRNAAIAELNALFEKGTLRDRHFEDVTARITRFDPATFLGDGVVSVSVTGKLVEIGANDQRRVVTFTQPLRFLRSYGADVWVAVDAQEPDGTWDSGGVLAISEIDRTFG